MNTGKAIHLDELKTLENWIKKNLALTYTEELDFVKCPWKQD